MIDFSRHALKKYDAEVGELFASLTRMGEHAGAMLKVLEESVGKRGDAAARAKAIDKHINALDDEINQQVNVIIARYQPIAEELRLILGIVRVSAVLESIGDMCKSCARRMDELYKAPATRAEKFRKLLKRCADTLEEAMGSINAFDKDTAKAIIARESKIDAECAALLDELKQEFKPGAPLEIAQEMILVRDIERIGDQCYMLAKLEYYFETGNAPRGKNFEKIGE